MNLAIFIVINISSSPWMSEVFLWKNSTSYPYDNEKDIFWWSRYEKDFASIWIIILFKRNM